MSTTASMGSRATLLARLAAMRLYVVTDAAQSPARTLAVVEAACAGGADVVQLRRKSDDARETLELAERCRAITARRGVLLVVDDRLDIALAAGADGVHLGQDDLPLAAARRLWPQGLIGCSTHSSEQLLGAQAEGADYLGVGPVHATPTKPGRRAVGVELVAQAAELARIPWVAIGGVDEPTVGAVLDAGASAVAVVRAVAGADDITGAARRLRDLVDAAVDRRQPSAAGSASRTPAGTA